MSDGYFFDPRSVYCRKHGTKVAECRPGIQAWYQNGTAARTPVFAVEFNSSQVWVDREGLSRLKRDRRTVGVVFVSRRGFNVAYPFEGEIGYQQLSCGGRVRVVYACNQWVRERHLELQSYESTSFLLPVVDQTAE